MVQAMRLIFPRLGLAEAALFKPPTGHHMSQTISENPIPHYIASKM
jgi:hypothetical protein